MSEKKLVRRKELLEITGVTVYQLIKFIKAGVIIPVRLPGMKHCYYRTEEVLELLGEKNED
jgi:predicted site-specific integrase-resolvase